MGRAREGRGYLSLVARLIEIGLVVRAIAVELRRACLKCVARRYNSGARRVRDRDAFGRITCYVDGIGDDNRNRVADMHDATQSNRWPRRQKHRAPASLVEGRQRRQ